jgi:hypothetical protein
MKNDLAQESRLERHERRFVPRRSGSAFADGEAGEIADRAWSPPPRARHVSTRRANRPGRQARYKALNSDGNQEFATVMKVIRTLGFRVHPEPASAA